MYQILQSLPLEDMRATHDWGLCYTPVAKLERRGSPVEAYHILHVIGVARALKIRVDGLTIQHQALRGGGMVPQEDK